MTSVVTSMRRGITASAAVKVPVKACTTANITLSGEQTIDGVAVVEDDRVLVNNQTDGSENGIYDVSTGDWVRAPDWDGYYDVLQGTLVYVSSGSTQQGFWSVSTADPITVGSTSVSLGRAFDGITIVSPTITTPDIDGGTIDGTVIGGTTPADGTFADLYVTGDFSLGNTTINNWNTSAHVVELGTRTALWNLVSTFLTQNLYYDASNYNYIENAEAAALNLQGDGDLSYSTAAAGTGVATLTERFSIKNNAGGQALHSDGTSALPSISFLSDPNTGFRWPALADTIYATLGGNDRAYINTSYIAGTTAGAAAMGLGTATLTSPTLLPYNTDANTGIGGDGSDQISMVAGGVAMITAKETGTASTDQVIIGTSTLRGGISTPLLAFGDGDSGFYEALDDEVAMVAGAQLSFFWSQNYMGSANPGGGMVTYAAASSTVPGLTFNADPDTGIGHPGANALSLITNATEAVRIDSSQNVGIGITPTDILTVGATSGAQNTVRINGNITANQAPLLSLYRTGARESFLAQVSSDLVIGNTGGLADYNDATITAGGDLWLDSNGNLGVGRAPTSSYPVDVYRTAAAGTYMNIENSGAQNTGYRRTNSQRTWLDYTSTIGEWNFYDVTGAATVWSFDTSGNAKLHTTAASLELPINNDAATPTLSFGDGDTGIYEASDGDVRIAIEGVSTWYFQSAQMGAVNGAGGRLEYTTSSSTNPTLLPYGTDTDTGIGCNGSNALYMIAGGVMRMQFDSSRAYITYPTNSAQLRLERTGTSAGSVYIGGDSSGLRVYDGTVSEIIRGENRATLGTDETSLWIWDNDASAMRQVLTDADDSAGTGFKYLMIAN